GRGWGSGEARPALGLPAERRSAWLGLIRSDNVGPRTFRMLLQRYGSARSALAAVPDLARRGGATAPPPLFSRGDARRELQAAKTRGGVLPRLGGPGNPPPPPAVHPAPPLPA